MEELEDEDTECCARCPLYALELPMTEGTRGGISARVPGAFMEDWRNGEGKALLDAEAEGEVASRLSHSSLQ